MRTGRVVSALLVSSATIVLLWLVFVVTWNRWLPPEWKYHRQLAQADALVQEIEAFRVAHGRLPSSTELLHDQTSDSVVGLPVLVYYFVSDDDQQYSVRLHVGFDESYVYKPTARTWWRTE